MKRDQRRSTAAHCLFGLGALLASIAVQGQTMAGATATPEAASTPATSGQALFESRCALCHRGSGPGVFMLERRLGKEQSILEERDNLSPEYLQAVVRNGIGSMPRFSRGELTDAELQQLIGWLAP